MTKKTLATGIAALTMMAAVVPASFAAEASTTVENTLPSGRGSGHGGGGMCMNEEAKAAIEANDYEAFLAACSDSSVTEEKFAEIVERHAEREERQAERAAYREAIEAAIESGDYTAWVAAHTAAGHDAPSEITADNFARYVEMHTARQNGDTETAQEIADELGIKYRGNGEGKGGHKHGRGFARGASTEETTEE